MTQEYKTAARAAITALLQAARPAPGGIVVVGCSTSEVAGEKIGSAGSPEIASALLEGILPEIQNAGLYLAAQCCEHLNRCLVVEAAALQAHNLTRVNAVPQPRAGGSFATAVWQAFEHPVLVQSVQAAAGLDIGGTLIGMHLMPVAVPVRLEAKSIGAAHLTAARTRPPYVGGERAVYDKGLE